MVMQITRADIERAIEIAAEQLPGIEQSGWLCRKIVLAIAKGIAEGRALGLNQALGNQEPSNDT